MRTDNGQHVERVIVINEKKRKQQDLAENNHHSLPIVSFVGLQ